MLRPPVDLRSIEALLRARLGRGVEVAVVDNRSTVLRSIPRRNGRCTVRLHRIFLEAPREILEAAAAWLRSGGRKRAARLNRFAENSLPRRVSPRPPPSAARGAVHDLRPLLERLSRRHFRGGLDLSAAWARPGRTGRPRTIKFGSYDPAARTIRIHPALDRAFVPTGYVEFILFHEMLHAALPPKRLSDGRRRHHHGEFRARERAYPGRERWEAWERENLSRLLREATPARLRRASPPRLREATPALPFPE